MITIRGLSKSYGDNLILKDIDCEIDKGEVISIIGPSGCGKSTLLRCLNLLETPTAGEIVVDGVNYLDPKADVRQLRRKMGMVFQSFNLFSHLMNIENIMLAPMQLRGLSPQAAYDEGMALLDMVGLGEKALKYPAELSGGQKQRIAIARALAMKPDILLFDEPTSALDPTMVSEVLSVIRNLAQEGMTMMIVTHEMKFAHDVSTRVFYMDDKGIYEDGPPEQIFVQPQKPKTRAFIKKIRALSYPLNSRRFDLFELSSKIETFLQKQLLPGSRINRVQLVCEEILYHGVLPLLTEDDFPAELIIEYGDVDDAITAAVRYHGPDCDPMLKIDNEASRAILDNCVAARDFTRDGEDCILRMRMRETEHPQ